MGHTGDGLFSSHLFLNFSPQKMKFLVLLALVGVVFAEMMENEEMMEKWMKMKAMESCWGKENMKLYTVSMKRAIAKCHQEDAPELSLPPFRSSYRFVNTVINQGNDMEMLKNMMFAMSMSMNRDVQKYTMPSPWFGQKYEQILDTCYEMATNLPAEI